MKKLIELDTALEGLENLNAISFYEANEHSKEAYTETKAMLKALPTVDAVPVKHGRWINEGVYGEGHSQCSIRCSNPLCNFHYIGYLDEYNYCPNCGAKMDGKGGDQT